MNGNLSQYRIFAVTAETKSISGAARKLYISQPAVSKSISNLEECMGTSLFVRGSRGVTLTDEGQILYRHVSEAFGFLEAGENELRRYHELGVGHLAIGASTTLSRYRLLPYLGRFASQYPHISLGISCQPTIQTLEMIVDGTIDIGLIARQHNMKNIGFLSLGEIRDIFVATPAYLRNMAIRENVPWLYRYTDDLLADGPAPADNPASAGSPSPADNPSPADGPSPAGSAVSGVDEDGPRLLDAATLMLLNKGNATRQFVDYYLEEKHIHPANMIEITTMDLLIEFVRAGLGIACVIEDFVRDDLRDGRLVRIPVGNGMEPREIGFAWNASRTPHRSLEIFREFIQQP